MRENGTRAAIAAHKTAPRTMKLRGTKGAALRATVGAETEATEITMRPGTSMVAGDGDKTREIRHRTTLATTHPTMIRHTDPDQGDRVIP